MNLSWLEDFLALAAVGNFSRAADERHMTQPAFSRRIRALEEWLGAELFDRSSQPARLTEAGQWFRRVAQEILAQVAKLPGEARALAEASAATLRFAATHALSFTFLPGWLRGLEAHASVGPLQLVSDVQPRCEALLLQNQAQFVLSYAHEQVPGPMHAAGCPSLLVGADILLPVAATGADGQPIHHLPAKGDAASVPMLGYSAESGLGEIFRAVLGRKRESLRARDILTAHLASVLRTMALDGRGLAWLPALLIQDDLAAGRLAVAASNDWGVKLEIRLYRPRVSISQAAEAFWKAATATA